MKKCIALLLASILLFVLTDIAYMAPDTATGEEQMGDMREQESPTSLGMELAAENQFLTMYFNPDTTEVAIKDKNSGYTWYTNPPDREQDSIATGVNKGKLGSQISITYYTPTAQRQQMDNFNDSIAHKQFEVLKNENGVKVVYTIGKVQEIMLVPQAISEERFEQILDKVTVDSDKSVLERRYRLISLEEIDDQGEKDDLLNQYPNLEDHDIYELRPNLNELVMQQLEEIFKATGYTMEDLRNDHLENNVQDQEDNENIFIIPLEYQLDGKNLIVSIDTEEIKYNPSYPLTQIRVLEFFGAGNKEDDGYMMVPDGSGALINMNNGKSTSRTYIGKLYGRDRAIKQEEIFERNEQVYLPVFGIKKESNALFGIIEEGSSFASIIADVSGRVNSYNTACAEFTTLANDVIDLTAMAGNNVVMAYQPRIYEGDFKIRYSFLSGEDANYVGMAENYREYLIDHGKLKKKEREEQIPFYLELIGAIDKIKPVAGLPIRGIVPLTTYEQAIEITNKVIDAGISNIKLKYTGWFNGGLRHSLPNNIYPQSHLGGRKGFSSLVDFVQKNGLELYPDVCFEYVYKHRIFDGFNVRSNAVRFLDREVALVYDFDPATNMYDNTKDPYHIVDPMSISPIVSSFLNEYEKLNLKGLSLKTMATDLSSNFNEKGFVDREQAKAVMAEQMDRFDQEGISIMANGVNDYALPYTSHILNMPMDSSGYNIEDESIPFYQIVVHGYVDYAGEPINLTGDYNRAVLKAAETGAGIYFTWIYGENSLVKDSDYNYLYSTNYTAWLNKAEELYKRINKDFVDLQDKTIVDHEKLAKDVYEVTYEGGKRVVVNYNKEPVSINDVVIEAESYKVFEGGNKK